MQRRTSKTIKDFGDSPRSGPLYYKAFDVGNIRSIVNGILDGLKRLKPLVNFWET